MGLLNDNCLISENRLELMAKYCQGTSLNCMPKNNILKYKIFDFEFEESLTLSIHSHEFQTTLVNLQNFDDE